MPPVQGAGEDVRIPGPTALRMLVGAQLRELRETRQITREDAGFAIRASASKISRLETGQATFKPRDVADLLTLYGVIDDKERSAIMILTGRANEPSWWHPLREVVPDWFEACLGLEQDAALIRTYEIQFVPGLLQTPGYARAVVSHAHRVYDEDQVGKRVELRMRRQRILVGASPVKLWAVVDEAALRRTIGGPAVMREQLRHLDEMNRLPNVTVQVVPLDSGYVSRGIGPVTLLRLAQGALPDVIYLERLGDAQYLTKDHEVQPYLHLLNEAGTEAEPATATSEILRRCIDDL
ncbi:helix-turn-helix domain-containing protein [Herbidospora galbida]|uniref:Helix-turn-helix domain-containing protein n=1 Tax=Herbidospora galbida TaxID=2575442 RepID=A0A4U3M6T1_9ACTN|nr:helix-turn-helix transcriptional regulator [Herbidospora galbida]TKK84501.1 helix-turn-helix domain-containing protein [Herbidospora galbida]